MSSKPVTEFSNTVAIVVPNVAGTIWTDPVDVDIHYVLRDATSDEAVSILNADGGLTADAVSVKAMMHVRGHATEAGGKDAPDKRQYTVHLDKKDKHHKAPADEAETKAKTHKKPFLGMPGDGRHWVFNDCGMMDYTLLRNALTFQAQRALGEYAPAFEYFELFIADKDRDVTNAADMTDILTNGYEGVYLCLDKIRFQKDRIDLPYNDTSPDGTHAILQLNSADAAKYYQLPDLALTALVQIYEPKKVHHGNKHYGDVAHTAIEKWYSGTDGWGAAFQAIFANMPTGVVPENYSGTGEKYWTVIRKNTHYHSFAIYFLLNELAKDPDGFHRSTFMVKNGDVCSAGPMWDKNKSYSNYPAFEPSHPSASQKPKRGQYNFNDAKGWHIDKTGYVPVWWLVFMHDAKFCAAVWDVWNASTKPGGVLTAQWMHDFIDTQQDWLDKRGMLQRNFTRWPSDYTNPYPSNYQASVDHLKDYIAKRLTWMGDNLGSKVANTVSS